MKIFICCSKHFYDKVGPIKEELEKAGHEITVPNSYEDPFREEKMKEISKEEYIKWKSSMIKLQDSKIDANDAILVLNFEKNAAPNYLGGGTFLEIFKAWDRGKKVFLFNPIPDSIFKDELTAMNPAIINEDLDKVK